MHTRSIFLMLFSMLFASHVQCARELNKWIESTYKECYLLNEDRSTLQRTSNEIIQLDRICLAKDNTYKFVSCENKFATEFRFDNLKIVRMDKKLMGVYARLTDLDWYTTAEVEFEQQEHAEHFFMKFLGPSEFKREKIIDVSVLEKIEKKRSQYDVREFLNDVQLKFIKHGGEKIFIVEKSTTCLVFSEKKFQLSRVINGQYIVMSVEGFADLFYILGFNKSGAADKFKSKVIDNALRKNELNFPNELNQFLGIQ